MTRFLSDILQASGLTFRQGLRQLEQLNGGPSTDIRLTAEVMQAVRNKLLQLGLDPADTTGKELYLTLQSRVAADDQRLEGALRTRAASHISAEADLMAGMVHALQTETVGHECFAIKTTVAKTLVKQKPPKKAVKQLGYRSLDSMLRHESPAAVIAAALLVETPAWRRSWFEQYKKLQPHDFESRPLSIVCSQSNRWQTLTSRIITEHRHTVLGLKELGAVVLLPLPDERPAGVVVATLVSALHEVNAIQAASSFLKLSQVRADFADRVRLVATREAELNTSLLDQPLPWHLAQRFYARAGAALQYDVFGPHVQAVDFHWHDVEAVLARLAPSLAFWQGTSALSLLHNHAPVSLNILDAARNCCNQAAFEARAFGQAQAALWHELTLRYVNQENIEQAIAAELQPELAYETAVN